MPEIKQLQCPTCGASVPTQVGVTRVTCEYCKSALAVQVDHGEMVLHSTEIITGAVRAESERTQATLQLMELGQRRAQLVQTYHAIRGQADNLDAELRALQRAKPSRLINEQFREVKVRREQLSQRIIGVGSEIAEINAILDPTPHALAAQQPSKRPVVKKPLHIVLRVIIGAAIGYFFVGFALTTIFGIAGAFDSTNSTQSADTLSRVITLFALIGGVLGFIYGISPTRAKQFLRRAFRRGHERLRPNQARAK